MCQSTAPSTHFHGFLKDLIGPEPHGCDWFIFKVKDPLTSLDVLDNCRRKQLTRWQCRRRRVDQSIGTILPFNRNFEGCLKLQKREFGLRKLHDANCLIATRRSIGCLCSDLKAEWLCDVHEIDVERKITAGYECNKLNVLRKDL